MRNFMIAAAAVAAVGLTSAAPANHVVRQAEIFLFGGYAPAVDFGRKPNALPRLGHQPL